MHIFTIVNKILRRIEAVIHTNWFNPLLIRRRGCKVRDRGARRNNEFGKHRLP